MKTNTKTPPTKPFIHMLLGNLVVYWFGEKGSTETSTIEVNKDGELFFQVGNNTHYLPKELQLI